MRFLPRDRHLIFFLLLLLGASAAYFTNKDARGHLGGVAELDGYYYYVYLRSLQVDGDLDLTNDYQKWGNIFKFGPTATGYARNIFGVGPALLWAPFFLLAHVLALIGIQLGFPLSLDGMSRFHQVITFYGSLLFGWLAVLFCYSAARTLFGRAHALWAALAAALAGPLPYYCLTYASYSHAGAAMTTSLLVLLWIRWRDAWTLRRWILWGAVAGLVVLVRPAMAAFLMLPLFEGLRTIWAAFQPDEPHPHWRQIRGPLLGALAALLVFSPQLLAWKIIFGSFWQVPQGEGFMRWTDMLWPSTLFSPRNGLFTSAPLMVLALLGLVIAIKSRRWLIPLALVFIGILLTNGAVYDWWGWGFSARRFTAALPIFVLGLAAGLCAIRRWLAHNPVRSIAWGTALFLFACVLFNLQWMRNFSRRNMDWYSVRSTEGLYMTVTHSLYKNLYDTLGNPFSLPGSIAFSLRKGGSLRSYDRLHGSYLLGEYHPQANPAADPQIHDTLEFADPRFRANLSDTFGYPSPHQRSSYVPLRAPRGHVFLPINRPGAMQLTISGRATRPGTKVEFLFNGRSLGRRDLPTQEWSGFTIIAPAGLVERGINRLDLIHTLPPRQPGRRCVGSTDVCCKVDMAAISGGDRSGDFAEIWVDEKRILDNAQGLNVAVVSPTTGEVLGSRSFDVFLYPAQFQELTRYLRLFPSGSVVALAKRGDLSRNFAHGGKEALGLIGAAAEQGQPAAIGYAVLGVIGARPGTALEAHAERGHARVHVGNPPPPWREIAPGIPGHQDQKPAY